MWETSKSCNNHGKDAFGMCILTFVFFGQTSYKHELDSTYTPYNRGERDIYTKPLTKNLNKNFSPLAQNVKRFIWPWLQVFENSIFFSHYKCIFLLSHRKGNWGFPWHSAVQDLKYLCHGSTVPCAPAELPLPELQWLWGQWGGQFPVQLMSAAPVGPERERNCQFLSQLLSHLTMTLGPANPQSCSSDLLWQSAEILTAGFPHTLPHLFSLLLFQQQQPWDGPAPLRFISQTWAESADTSKPRAGCSLSLQCD